MIVILTNIPTPYRTEFFNALSDVCNEYGERLHVIYCATTEDRREWPFRPELMTHDYTVLPGIHLKVHDYEFHINVRVLNEIMRLGPKYVLCAGAWNMPTLLLALLFPPVRAKFIFWSEGHVDAVLHPKGVISVLRRRVLGAFDGYAVPNLKSEGWIRDQVGSAKGFIRLPNTVNEIFYRRVGDDERNIARNELGISMETKVLLQVSRVVDIKGVSELVNSFLKVSDELAGNNSILVVLGSGPMLEELKSRVSERGASKKVMFLGHVDENQVRRWLMAADWFVLNTKRDPNPLTPIEASFAGLPLLLSVRAGNHDELLLESKTGYPISNPSDPSDALRQAIMCSREEERRLGLGAMNNVQAEFARKSVARSLIEQINALFS